MTGLREALNYLLVARAQSPGNKKIQLAIDVVSDVIEEKHQEDGNHGKAG